MAAHYRAEDPAQDPSVSFRRLRWEDRPEHDACAIVARVRKDGVPTHGNVERTLAALGHMAHRTGEIDQEGDGTGIQTDIPRDIWKRKLDSKGLREEVVVLSSFTVGHILIRDRAADEMRGALRSIREVLMEHGFDVVYMEKASVRSEALGPLASDIEPVWFQVACVPKAYRRVDFVDSYNASLAIEGLAGGIHVASLGHNSVVYKVRGDVKTLGTYFPDLSDPGYKSAIALGHGRYSTNTCSVHERAQMCSTLGHNGEINTIAQLRRQMKMLGLPAAIEGSDSQDVDRLIEGLMFRYGFSLMEAMEIVFPPVWSEVKRLPESFHSAYRYFRRALGLMAQGPAAIIARQGDELVFSVDVLGLRPLWVGETEKEFFASSEKSVFGIEAMVSDPQPLAPGEKRAFQLRRPEVSINPMNGYPTIVPGGVTVFENQDIQHFFSEAFNRRRGNVVDRLLEPEAASGTGPVPAVVPIPETKTNAMLSAFGWQRGDIEMAVDMAGSGKEVIGSIGYDGPLAVLSDDLSNLSDFFKERVAVVTNPAIDRVREGSHFSTEVFLGGRPDLRSDDPSRLESLQIRLNSPLVPAAATFHQNSEVEPLLREASSNLGVLTLEQIIAGCRDNADAPTAITLSICYPRSLPLVDALRRLERKAVESARAHRTSIIVLDDRDAFTGSEGEELLPIDAHLAVAVVNRVLENERRRWDVADLVSLRRTTSLVLCTGAIRHVHDAVVALGLGANAISPYLLIEQALSTGEEGPNQLAAVVRLLSSLTEGIEKVISTIGIHELAGYWHGFASIGLTHELAIFLGVTNYCGHATRGWGIDDLERTALQRLELALSDRLAKPPVEDRLYPKIWKLAGDVAQSQKNYTAFMERVKKYEIEAPVALRHTLELAAAGPALTPEEVDLTIDGYDAPFYIPAMSFGSQGETSFRAYAEAARRLNVPCINGEGGEIPDMIGRYWRHRGQQVASGRFGVNARMLNSGRFIEIKIGQGAKPGEGGHLPGFKVTGQIAAARHTNPGVDLISPSNNHDLYSIEDLAQLIEELKTVNPEAKISVKLPCIPGIGVIATGVAKAGADIIGISGYDGGTGAARKHALKHVGFPVELGIKESHNDLIENGLRHLVELWADGGQKTAEDVLRMLCLGADRVGFGTLSMVAIGCTICRDCSTGTCHTGITAHFKSEEDALEAGLRRYTPRDPVGSVERLVHLYSAMREEIQVRMAQLGVSSARQLVGRSDLLQQVRRTDSLCLDSLIDVHPATAEWHRRREKKAGERVVLKRPRTSLTRTISSLFEGALDAGHSDLVYVDDEVKGSDRAIGTYFAGRISRPGFNPPQPLRRALIRISGSSVPGNGLGAFSSEGLDIDVSGGAMDSTAKCASGGRISILRGPNHNGLLIDGSVGKAFAYGAQEGLFIVQGDADSRAGIRLSGADLVFGGTPRAPLDDRRGNWASRANLKGFAFEYMTSGRAVVFGDPGPWLCSGMTGGTIFFRLDPTMGLTEDAIQRRFAKGASARLSPVSDTGLESLSELIDSYAKVLSAHPAQEQAVRFVEALKEDLQGSFVQCESPKTSLTFALKGSNVARKAESTVRPTAPPPTPARPAGRSVPPRMPPALSSERQKASVSVGNWQNVEPNDQATGKT